MAIFISYARADRDTVRTMELDLERTKTSVWIDRELEGGQSWWDVILGQIRTCELFVFALSPDSLKSKACMAELGYAMQLGRPLLPVMVRATSVQLAPRAIADTHIVDYTERTPESAVNLVTAVLGRQPAPPLPDPLPFPPPTPMSYLNPFREQIAASALSFPEQTQLVAALRTHLDDDDARASARQLLGDLRRRPDIVESVGRDIDAVLGQPAPVGAASTSGSRPAPTSDNPAGWHPDPTGRYTHRYWDGSIWTDHVSSAAGTASDPLTAAPPDTSQILPQPGSSAGSATASWASTAPAPEPAAGPAATAPSAAIAPGDRAPLNTGVYVLLIIGAVFIGLVGVIAGGVNLKYPSRNGQAKVLLGVGIASFILGFMMLSSGGY